MEKRKILKLLERVKYPGFSRDIVSFGMVGNIAISDQNIELTLNISTENTDKINGISVSPKKYFCILKISLLGIGSSIGFVNAFKNSDTQDL